jgi:GrpB-like predicted nucleotidyltransferase (UPF0157 family)
MSEAAGARNSRAGDGSGERSVGAGDGPIEIVDYDEAWPACYLSERARLSSLLPELRVHHIGSTAVRGLAAKPVIDMIAFVDDLDARAAELAQRAGYHLPGPFNADLEHRRFLCYPSLVHRTHHLHLVDRPAGLESCLRFRDRLREDPQLAGDYAALKRALAERFREDRMRYTTAKTGFIKNALAAAPPRRRS